MENMKTIMERESEVLETLAKRLRMRRLAAGDRQEDMAARIGTSRATYRKMESGDPTVRLGLWVRAFEVLGQPDQIYECLPLSLFDEAELEHRRRVGRGRRRG